jgi:cytidylate kinase
VPTNGGPLASADQRVVTVDGPAGSGKSTLGRRLASALLLPFVDTGLLYRGVTVAAVRAGIDAHDPDALVELAARTRIDIRTDPGRPPGPGEVVVDGEDAAALLRDPRYAALLSQVSAIPEVRSLLLAPQRELAAHGAVAVGRDCGTVVFPSAPVKFFLWATAETRMRRRALQLSGLAPDVQEESLRADVGGRDRVDSTRRAAPLRAADDAHIIDTGALDVDGMVEHALAMCEAAGLMPA